MNTTKLKTYAPQARKDFIQAMKDRAAFYGITEKKTEPIIEKGTIAVISGHGIPRSVAAKRTALEKRITEGGFNQTMEALAYTWFNRFVAIRYMELHGYLDHGYRVLSHPEGKSMPEILEHAEHIDLPGIDKNTIIDLKLAGHKESELYRLLLIAQCNALHSSMPFLFERIDDETELLLPDNLLSSDSLIRSLVANLDAEDCESVEVLGWLYQFYISEKKDQVMARKSAVPTEDIPAVTQLFTPHWIVRYLVENSLGRLWLLNRPGSRLREHMPYYIEGEKNAPDGSPDDFLKITKPEEIRLCDPAAGSGHMLTYAFDLLNLIYEEEGYAPTEIPALILQHNLHGLEICPRAAQLAELALIFKAREKSRRFFQPEHLVRPRIIELRDVRFVENELRDYFKAIGIASDSQLTNLLHQFEEAKNFGSLIQPCLDEHAIADIRSTIEGKDLSGQLFLRETHLKVLRVLDQAEALTQRYHVVVANPPYMGGKGMNVGIKNYLKEHFADYKSDLFAAFIVRALSLALSNGYLGFMSPFVWMFISSFEKLRERLIDETTITTLVQLEYSGFDGATVPICTFTLQNKHFRDFQGGYIRLSDFPGSEHQGPKTLEAIRDKHCGWFFFSTAEEFKKIPGSPIAYWVSEKLRAAFELNPILGELIEPRQGMATTNNNLFLRLWHEIQFSKIGLGIEDSAMAKRSLQRWFPYNKGGEFRKWYGNNWHVVNYFNDGEELKIEVKAKYREKEYAKGFSDERWDKLIEVWVLKNQQFYFKPSITWTYISSSKFGARYCPKGFIFDVAGSSIFPSEEELLGYSAMMCSSIQSLFLKALNPTLNFQVENIAALPVHQISIRGPHQLASDAIVLARADWDNFETSWEFRDQPLLRPGLKGATLEASWRNWEAQSTAAIRRMQELETENNRLFINAYGLAGELQPEVPEEQITLFCNPASRYKRKAKKKKTAEDDSPDDTEGQTEAVTPYTPEERSNLFKADTMREFLSYAVGCMMGRYSPDHPGLVYAHSGNIDFEKIYFTTDNTDSTDKKEKPESSSSVESVKSVVKFLPDKDGIIPLLNTDWGIADDATDRVVEFFKAIWPIESLEENLFFISQSLGATPKEPSRDVIRNYFSTSFYKDHLQKYKKRPIYWLFSSGKLRAFQCLVYLHRYNEGTLSRMRTEYVHTIQSLIAARIAQLEDDKLKATSTSHRNKLQKEQNELKKQQEELKSFEEKLKHAAERKIKLDLDDGVKVNYAKFTDNKYGEILAEVKAITGGSEE